MAEKASSSNHIDPHTAAALVRRLLTEYGLTRWKRYAFAFTLMGVGAACVYAHAHEWPFTRKMSPKMLRFSERGLRAWLEHRRSAP